MINLNYFSVFGRRFSLAANLFGVQMYNQTTDDDSTIKPPHITRIQYIKMILLQFRAELPHSADKQAAIDWELGVGDYFHQ
jgi:hypothetical protein